MRSNSEKSELPKNQNSGSANLGPAGFRNSSQAPIFSPSTASSVLNTKHSSDPRSLGNRMTAHGLLLDNSQAFDRYPNFQAKIYSIIDKGRLPNPNPASEKKLKRYLQKYDRANEATLLMHIMPILLKDGFYTKELKPGMSEEDRISIEKEQAVFRKLLIDEDIVINRDEELRGTLLPNKYMNQGFEEEMEKELRKGDKMKNARPDFIFGVSSEKFPQTANAPIPLIITNLLTITSGMYHPFLIIEGKEDQGSTAQAQDHCRRGGSTLVHAARILSAEVRYSKLEQGTKNSGRTVQTVPCGPSLTHQEGPTEQDLAVIEQKENADTDTFVFSVTISPTLVEFYVNWYEEHQKDANGISSPLFHMNRIKSTALNDRKALQEIRHAFHNICDWGANERLEEQTQLHNKLLQYASEV